MKRIVVTVAALAMLACGGGATGEPSDPPTARYTNVRAGDPCSPAGATGYTSKGVEMECVRVGRDRPRWRRP